MSGARFVPLVCKQCGGTLDGRLADRVAFCARCEVGFACDGPVLEHVRVWHVPVEGETVELYLPFWHAGTIAFPAFYGSRLLTLARMATGQLETWRKRPGFGSSPPLGARIGRDCLTEAAGLLGLEAPDVEQAGLLAIPLLATGTPGRFVIAGTQVPLFREDISELAGLTAAPA